MSKVIEVTVSPQGEAVVKTHGFAGESCRDATRKLEQALGLRQSEVLTPEFHAPVTVQQQEQRQ